jgi:hypothetical protein
MTTRYSIYLKGREANMGIGEILALLIGGGSLLSSLFGGGGGNQQEQTTTSETTNPKYRSPALGMMEPGILSALLGNAQALGGAGMPGGVSRFGGNADSMFEDILGLLQKDWPNVMGEYGSGSAPGNVQNCIKKCEESTGDKSHSKGPYVNCFLECKEKGGA